MAKNWHCEDLNTIEARLRTDLSEGLTSREARERLDREMKKSGGYRSTLFVGKRKPTLECLATFLFSPSVILLMLISLLSAIFGRFVLGASVLIVAIACVVLGGILNLRAQRILESMREYASPMIKVKRGGNIYKTDGRNVVAGDVIVLSVGDILPCDARLISSENFAVEEIARNDKTIIRRRVDKNSNITYNADDNVSAPEPVNMLYAGSAVCAGSAIAVVTSTSSDTYLSSFLPDGALAAKDSDSEAVKKVKPTYYKIVFICTSALLILSLVSLLTLQKVEFLSVFLTLLASVALVTVELLSTVTLHIFSARIKKRALIKKGKNVDNYAAIRNVKTFDTLTGVTDLVLIGKVGLSDGIEHIFSAYTVKKELKDLKPRDECGKRLLSCIFTYVKALRDGNVENYFSENGYEDSLFAQVRNSGFDISGASLAIKSLYYAYDKETDIGYACADTALESYRVALTFDDEAIKYCSTVRDGDKIREITSDDIAGAEDFISNAKSQGLQTITVLSEYNGTVIFEGVLSLTEYVPVDLQSVIDEFDELKVKRTVLLSEESEENINIVKSFALAPLFDGEIAYASKFRRDKKSITDGIGRYCAYVGFDDKEYCLLVSQMKRLGSRVACYGIDNSKNGIMACADVAISCDTIRYYREEYRASVYEKTYPEGRDTNIRCSQQTRLLSRVIVHRSNDQGGGLLAIAKSLRTSRSSYVTLAQSMLLFVFLMSNMLSFTVMSVLTGNVLLNPIQTAVLSAVFAFLSVTVFAESEHKREIVIQNRDYTKYPIEIIRENIVGIISRASIGVIFAITVKILDILGVFGEKSVFTLPVYICLSLTLFAEVFIINKAYTKSGDARQHCWLKVTVAYAILIGLVGLTTYSVFGQEFFPHGIGSREFIAIAGYAVLYAMALAITDLITKKKKKA